MAKIVIIGAGFGGLRAARALAKTNAEITLIDRRNHHLFQPLLYQVATAGLSSTDIAYPIRSVLRGQSNAEVILGEVTAVDKKSKNVTVNFESGSKKITFDTLIIATGANHSYFGHDDWEKNAPGLKTLSDATEIRQKVLLAFEQAEMETVFEERKKRLTFTIVGAGPTGVELAGSIAELARHALASDFRHIDPKSARILLIEAGPRILAGFHENLSKKANEALVKLGVEVLVGTRVENVDDEGVVISGRKIFSKTVIWAAGVVASPAAKWLDVEHDQAGRVKVRPDLTIEGHDSIFVIGDTAHVEDENGKPLPGVAPVAMQAGRFVAKLIKARLRGKETKDLRFHYVDKGNLATIGRSSAIAEIGKIRISGGFAWLTWLVVHIFYLIGFRNRIIVIIQWAWAYFTFQRGARIITNSEQTSDHNN